eukprot:m.618658 g.618658  ORF g.618658 m.618658 type:complete len:92 (+) comp58190_c1_seq16:534-809(+)
MSNDTISIESRFNHLQPLPLRYDISLGLLELATLVPLHWDAPNCKHGSLTECTSGGTFRTEMLRWMHLDKVRDAGALLVVTNQKLRVVGGQ